MAKFKQNASKMKPTQAIQPASTDNRVIELLKFAPEIRNRFYDIIFVKPTNIGSRRPLNFTKGGRKLTKGMVRTKDFYNDAASWRNLAFARTCRQVYTESSYVFYARNGFDFHFIRPMAEFLEAIGLGGRLLLRKLRFFYAIEGIPLFALRYLKSCKNLQQLDVYISYVPRCTAFEIVWALKQPLAFFLGDHAEVEFDEVCTLDCEIRSNVTPLPMNSDLRRSLTCSLLKITNGEDGRWGRQVLPDVFVDKGCLLVNEERKMKGNKKEPERTQRLAEMEVLLGQGMEARDKRTKASRNKLQNGAASSSQPTALAESLHTGEEDTEGTGWVSDEEEDSSPEPETEVDGCGLIGGK